MGNCYFGRSKRTGVEVCYLSKDYDKYILLLHMCGDLQLIDLCKNVYNKILQNHSTFIDHTQVELGIIRLATEEQQQIILCLMDAIDCGVLNKSHGGPSPIYKSQWQNLPITSRQYIWCHLYGQPGADLNIPPIYSDELQYQYKHIPGNVFDILTYKNVSS